MITPHLAPVRHMIRFCYSLKNFLVEWIETNLPFGN